MQCLKCGHVNETGKKFCPKCGASLAEAARIEAEKIAQARLLLEKEQNAALLEQKRVAQRRQRDLKLWHDRVWGNRISKIRTITAGSATLLIIALIAGGVRRSVEQHKAVGEMVVVPAGAFMMGSPDSEPERGSNEGPRHSVNLKSFRIGKYDITFAQWDACVAEGGCGGYSPGDNHVGRDVPDHPVVNVSWNDVQQFISWANNKTGQRYRLPTEAEWEYAARAGRSTTFYWGDAFDPSRVPRSGHVERVGSYAPNAFGLYDITGGNVAEWVSDCYNDNFVNAPTDGSAWSVGDCTSRMTRGASWSSPPKYRRLASRDPSKVTDRYEGLGFRLAQDQ